MKILMSGATGFVGRHYIQKHPQYQFVALCRSPDKAKRVLPRNVECISSLAAIDDQETFDVVINLAGEPIVGKRWSPARKMALQQSRWQITQELVEWIERTNVKPKCFLSGSAIGVYGIDDDYAFLESDVAHCEDFSSSLCRHWEEIGLQAEAHTRVVLLRTGIVLGDGGVLDKMLLPFKLGLGGPIGSGKQWMSWIHIHDYLAALDFLIDNNACSGAFNLSAPEPVMNQRFVKALGDALHRPAFMPLPAFVLKVALGEASTILLDGQKVLPKKLEQHGFKFIYTHIEQALCDLLRK